jgi:hypothetical protein
VRFGVRMSAGVRCGAARPVQLRGAARSVLLLQRVAPASRGSQRFGRCARLDQGCAARLVVAAEGEPEPAALHSAAEGEAEPQKRRRKRAPNVGERGETTADGKPEPDERTVEDLVRRGWFESEEDAEALLTRKKSQHQRFPYETAQPAADWLETMLGLVQLKGGLLPAAKAVKACPQLLCQDAATLQRSWDALTLPAEQGGVGIAFSEEQAREAVLKHPRVLSYATDTLKRGWLMLTATEGGLGLSPDEARSCILRCAEVLRFDHDAFVRRVELLIKEPRLFKGVQNGAESISSAALQGGDDKRARSLVEADWARPLEDRHFNADAAWRSYDVRAAGEAGLPERRGGHEHRAAAHRG